ncbi:MAG: hypothetical protein R2857_02300 [Vampirovibrionales bacterium]
MAHARLPESNWFHQKQKDPMPVMPMQPSKKLSQIPPYLIAELDKKVEAAKAQGRDIISLGVGDPDLPTPQLIVDQLKQSAQDASTHNYPPYQGTKPFRTSRGSLDEYPWRDSGCRHRDARPGLGLRKDFST